MQRAFASTHIRLQHGISFLCLSPISLRPGNPLVVYSIVYHNDYTSLFWDQLVPLTTSQATF